jgi:GTPase KRas protein
MSVSEYKQVILGGGAVGKSSLTMMFLQHHFIIEYDPTIEDAYRKQVLVDDQVVLLDILDTAGQEEYSAMRDQYMRTGNGFMLVYSVADRTSFEECVKLREKIYQIQDKSLADAKDDLLRVPLILVGNKCDLENERQVSNEEGKELAKQWGCTFFEASAKSRIHVDDCFFELVRAIRTQRELRAGTKRQKSKKPFKKLTGLVRPEEKCSIL